MLAKLSLTEKALHYANPTTKAITNTIADAVATSSFQAHAYTSTLRSDFDEVRYTTSGTDVDITAARSLLLGVFLSNTLDSSNMYHIVGNIKLINFSAVYSPICSFGFGRCNASTITQSDAAPANLVDNIFAPPMTNLTHAINGLSSTVQQLINMSVNEYIVVDRKENSSTNPVAFYASLSNFNSANVALVHFSISLSIRSMMYPLPINTPSGM